MARLYANENFSLPVVEELRRLGHDVLTTLDAGKAGQAIPDEEVLVYAHSQARILLTFNRRHFIRLHMGQAEHSGIIACTYDTDSIALAQRIDQALTAEGQMNGRLSRVNRPAVQT
jgi:hypothetical protein